MSCEVYDYRFSSETDMTSVEELLLLAAMAAEGLHGRARMQLDAAFICATAARQAQVDASTEVGAAIARIFTALLTATIGEPAFKVERTVREESKC